MVINTQCGEVLNPPLLWTTPYMVKAPFSPTFHNIWKYCRNEIQDKHKKNSQEKLISSKQHFLAFISDKLVSNTD